MQIQFQKLVKGILSQLAKNNYFKVPLLISS
jgi:hypothetical protein